MYKELCQSPLVALSFLREKSRFSVEKDGEEPGIDIL
jgi:hypothetical protein